MMTDKHISWLMFAVSLIMGVVFLSVLVKVNLNLEQMNQALIIQQKQIDRLNDENHVLHEQVLKLTQIDDQLAHDIDVTQELQRKQAQVVVDLKKGRKK